MVKHREAPPSDSGTTTTTIFTPEALLEQLQSNVAMKLDCSLAAHHMTYGALLREIEKLVFERKAAVQTAHASAKRADLASRQLDEAHATIHELQHTVDSLRRTVDEKEHAMLKWGQRYGALEADMRHLRSELERAVQDADHNRLLLATEVRSRAALLETVHEDVRNDLQRRLEAPRCLSPAATTHRRHDGSPPPRPLGTGVDCSGGDGGTGEEGQPLDERLQSISSPVRREPPEAVAHEGGSSVTSPGTSFHQLHRMHEDVIADVRRQLAVDVPRRLVDGGRHASPNQAARDYYNGAHHSTTTVASGGGGCSTDHNNNDSSRRLPTTPPASSQNRRLRDGETTSLHFASPMQTQWGHRSVSSRAVATPLSKHRVPSSSSGMLSPPPPPWRSLQTTQ